MFDDKTILIDSLRNPMTIAKLALDEMQNRLDGKITIADPNTPFCQLLEFGSSIAANVIKTMDEKLPTLYPKRAESMEDLFNHMSDFDYTNMYATPANTIVRFTLPKKYLITNSIAYNSNYKLVKIPRDTVFTVGKYVFGMYYPIDILINNYTNTFTTIFDTEEINPLHKLTTNIVEKYDLTYKGLDYIVIDMPIYQFAKSTVEESLIAETGYVKKIVYNNSFYALRIFTVISGEYIELSQSQSFLVYDALVPTALVQVLSDINTVKITIPQIYFDNNQMGNKIIIEIYTTLGELNIDTTNISVSSISANFTPGLREDPVYSAMFKKLPFEYSLTLSADAIIGGSDATSVDVLRERIVNGSLYQGVPITEAEMSAYMNDQGFYVKKFLDNVTDRIYYAYRVIKDGSGSIIPSVTTQIKMYGSYATDRNHSPFLYQTADNSITILPTALYEYNQDADSVVPLDDTAMRAIVDMEKDALAEYLNNHQILKSPYHLRVDISSSYPSVIAYDLYTPDVKKVIFEDDNADMAEKMLSFGAKIAHSDIGEYVVTFSVYKSDEVKALNESDIKIYATTYSRDGLWAGTECRWVYDDQVTGRSIYQFTIPTSYHLTDDNGIGINFPQSNNGVVTTEQVIDLVSDFHLVFMVNRMSLVSTVVEPSAKITQGVPESYTTLYLALSRQYLTLSLGKSLKDVMNCNIEASSTRRTYAVYESDVPAHYEEDVYERTNKGFLRFEVDENDNLHIRKLHSVGDPVFDINDRPVYKHRKGDIIYGPDNQPVVSVDAQKIYYITAMFLDAKIFFSDRTAELNFQTNMYKILDGYFTTVRNIQDQLLERTNIYFRCVRSTGMSIINRGDEITEKQNIELSFKIVCYVPSYVKQDLSIQNKITEMTCAAIEEAIDSKTISMLDIFKQVKEQMSDYIDHFDLLGVNGDTTLQTFIFIDEDAQPSVARKLELTDDNLLSLNKQVDITYVALTNNTTETTTFTE